MCVWQFDIGFEKVLINVFLIVANGSKEEKRQGITSVFAAADTSSETNGMNTFIVDKGNTGFT